MGLIFTLLLYVITFFVALWVGGGLLGLLFLPLTAFGKRGVFVADVISGIAVAWIAIGIFHWAGRNHIPILVLLLVGTLWNDFRRGKAELATLAASIDSEDEGRAREGAKLEATHLVGT